MSSEVCPDSPGEPGKGESVPAVLEEAYLNARGSWSALSSLQLLCLYLCVLRTVWAGLTLAWASVPLAKHLAWPEPSAPVPCMTGGHEEQEERSQLRALALPSLCRAAATVGNSQEHGGEGTGFCIELTIGSKTPHL